MDRKFINKVQSLLDAGYARNKVASMLNVHHSKVDRLLKRGLVEIYTAFDEDDMRHLYQNFEWLWEEDKLEELCNVAADDLEANINTVLGENYLSVGKYVRENYGDIHTYLRKKNLYFLSDLLSKECTKCGDILPIKRFRIRASKGCSFGINSNCKDCDYLRIMNYCRENPDFMKVHSNNRRARKTSLPDTLILEEYRQKTLLHFENGCALTGRKNKVSLDHAIPIAVGHGGTTLENCYPLDRSLNSSKNDSNIFEWFEANRQRFELSQERFDNLIAWLASANAMTVAEYRDYVYWCHANPRSIDELTDDVKEVI